MQILLVYNWPGLFNSEFEIIRRIVSAAESMGHVCSVIDPFGHPLNESGEKVAGAETVDARRYDFCLNLHFTSPHILDTFSYAANWNPFDYVVRNPMTLEDLSVRETAFHTACIQSHHAILSTGAEVMDDFMLALNRVVRHHVSGDRLRLHATIDADETLAFPDFERFRLFYIGINWERQYSRDRHRGLITLLDESGLADFYGVREQNGIPMWEGVKHYRGELPFDCGRSILQKSNECGVSLVLHSESHRASGMTSTRIFQACAAKTLMISDDNPFVLKHFGDSVLTFECTGDPYDNFKKIRELAEWIGNNTEKAREKAVKAHRIFLENFSLKSDLSTLIGNHDVVRRRYLEELGARKADTKVDVVYSYYGLCPEGLEIFMSDLDAQENVEPRALVFACESFWGDIERLSERFQTPLAFIPLETKRTADGFPLRGRVAGLALKEHVTAPYAAFYEKNTRWHRFHLTHLVRSLEGGGNTAQSGVYVKNDLPDDAIDRYYERSFAVIGGTPEAITPRRIGAFDAHRFHSSSMLFRADAFREPESPAGLRFFDAGFAFYLVAYDYVMRGALPNFVPKLTDAFLRDDGEADFDMYLGSRQTLLFERSLAYAFFKYSPKFLQFADEPDRSDVRNDAKIFDSTRFSLDDYCRSVLKHRPGMLKFYDLLFKIGCRILGMSS